MPSRSTRPRPAARTRRGEHPLPGATSANPSASSKATGPGAATGSGSVAAATAAPTTEAATASGAELAALQALSSERQELLCSLIGLSVKVALVLVAGVSLTRLATAYQERMDRQGELAAVLELERTKLAKARERFDQLFMVEGEQRLIREQNQWIAPNRLRVVWQPSTSAPEPGRPTP